MEKLFAQLGGSPKFHDQLVIVPELGVEISVKVISLVSQEGAVLVKSAVGREFTTTVVEPL